MKNPRKKEKAGANERKDIEYIVNSIHVRNETGVKLINAFHNKFGIEITDARNSTGSNRNTHYDFEIQIRLTNAELVWKKVEHKGCRQFKPIGIDQRPWTAGVQFHNGGCDKYTIAKTYAQIWYTIHIGSCKLKNIWNITAPIPTFNDWYKLDCCVQGDPKTPFGIELKRKVREKNGVKSSLLAERKSVLEAINMTEADKNTLIQELLPIANTVLEEKDYWLTIHGLIESNEWLAEWYPQFTISAINDVVMEKKKDIFFKFYCSNNFTFNAILRWGKGAGFSCLRIDLR